MKKTSYILVLIVFLLPVRAQKNPDWILESIRQNNTTLNALREKASADKIGNRTGLNPSNPEVEFGYLWGSPSETGNRKDFSVTQTFDFPLAYRYKNQLSKGQNNQVDLILAAEERVIIQQARVICIELIYRNKLNEQLSNRLKYAEELAVGYEILFAKGEINIIDFNKTKLNLLNTQKEYEVNRVEKAVLSDKLQVLNGGLPVESYGLNEYASYLLPVDFLTWVNQAEEVNPTLQAIEQSIALSKKQEQLTKAMNLPKLTAGYLSERVPGTTQQGITVGVTIPLWEGRNTVKHLKAQTIAIEAQEEDARLQFRNEMKNQFDKAIKLRKVVNDYELLLESSNSEALLDKAFKQGQLSLINYLLELSAFYDAFDQYLEAQKDYQLAAAELKQWE